MINEYTIMVKNDTSDFKEYYIFSELPEVTPPVNGNLWSNILVGCNVQPDKSATFTIETQFHAVVGCSAETPAHGVVVNANNYRNVTLGSLNPTGGTISGTTLELDASDGAPFFTNTVLPDGGMVNAFQVKAPVGGSHFKISDAKTGNFFVGVGSSASDYDGKPTATFMPEPNASYQIKPTNQYYLTFGSYTPGQLVDVTMMASDTVLLDFSYDNAPSTFYVVNNDSNQLLVQSEPF
ncbi:hypothetical protein P153DRAFT_385308 [Dothidotthia symphoricarpi CBS 119687]|uniref:Uncharacterized protein n=1 Tax=Dothidotthia symphoricarpi CBS 119687 TaxID=1392245 RepID=A0A6A6ADU7_9PLEO|nr:uncharacterized protein P153DRAFT_385308 [Dothidotthia symphoricarpi CBS 119687]KAF2130072.1 hypothetical protein P153DRAFT_385308 [Dothidotthia symphoricarpi CBS 119687]